MSERTILLPLDFNDGVPKDRILFDAVQVFCEAEFGVKLNLAKNGKTWAAVKVSDTGEGYEVIGLTSIAFAIDCPVFHVKPAADDANPAQHDAAKAVRDKLMERASAFIQDSYGPGTEVFVHVAPDVERFWKGYLRMIGAKPSNRVIVKI